MPFADITGHDRIVEVLRRSLRSGKLSHSYIFEGIPGCGRRATARMFIQALYCQERGDDACGSCPSCRKVAAGNHADIHLLEPLPDKRDISVDQIRELQRELALRPYEAIRKACLIEPAERMNANSANSLLKTLEEPPGNALIILLTENADILLPTIRSRCQVIRFAPLSPEHLRSILRNKGIEDSRAEVLSTMAEGSVQRALERDNEGLLELQKSVLTHLTTLSLASIKTIFDAAEELSGNRDETLQSLDILISFMRDTVHLAAGSQQITNSSFQQLLQSFANRLPLERAVSLLEALLETRRSIQRNANAKLSLDCLFIKMGTALS